MKPLIAIDIGNTSTHIAVLTGKRWHSQRRVPTAYIRTQALTAIKPLITEGVSAVIGSVVPRAGGFLQKAIASKLSIPAHLIGPKYPVPIKNLYQNSQQVGIDRLLNGLAAFKKTRGAVIVIDFGTAITFDIVSKKGEYLGGVIAPGIEISLEALFQKTALLPKIRLEHPKRIIGKDTIESIRVGCSVGIGGLCDRIIEEVEKKHHLKAKVLATGGYASFMSKYCRKKLTIDPNLIFKGIELTYLFHQPK